MLGRLFGGTIFFFVNFEVFDEIPRLPDIMSFFPTKPKLLS
jgi:hypothetical protein